MALINNNTGEYLKITAMQFDYASGNHHISYYIFANQEQRLRYDNGLTPYEIYKSGQYNGIGNIESALNTLPAGIESARAAVFNACYNALQSDMFNDWVGDE